MASPVEVVAWLLERGIELGVSEEPTARDVRTSIEELLTKSASGSNGETPPAQYDLIEARQMLAGQDEGRYELERVRSEVTVLRQELMETRRAERLERAAVRVEQRAKSAEASYLDAIRTVRKDHQTTERWSIGVPSGFTAISVWFVANASAFEGAVSLVSPAAAAAIGTVGIVLGATVTATSSLRAIGDRHMLGRIDDEESQADAVRRAISTNVERHYNSHAPDRLRRQDSFSRAEYRQALVGERRHIQLSRLFRVLFPLPEQSTPRLPDGTEQIVDASLERMVARGWLKEERVSSRFPLPIYTPVEDESESANRD